jgi:hypothetical protein
MCIVYEAFNQFGGPGVRVCACIYVCKYEALNPFGSQVVFQKDALISEQPKP